MAHNFYKLSWEYHERTERFDRETCTASYGNTAVPNTVAEAAAVNRNARSVLLNIAARERLSASEFSELRAWISRVAREFEASLKTSISER